MGMGCIIGGSLLPSSPKSPPSLPLTVSNSSCTSCCCCCCISEYACVPGHGGGETTTTAATTLLPCSPSKGKQPRGRGIGLAKAIAAAAASLPLFVAQRLYRKLIHCHHHHKPTANCSSSSARFQGGGGGGYVSFPTSYGRVTGKRMLVTATGTGRLIFIIILLLFLLLFSVVPPLRLGLPLLLMPCNNSHHHHHPAATTSTAPLSFPDSNSRSGYTVLINTWKRDSLLKQAVAHYASCSLTDAIHVVWSERDPPSDSLKASLRNIMLSQSKHAHNPNFRFELNEEDDLNNRFKPIDDPKNDAIFSVDDDVIIPCTTLNYAFTVWQTAPDTMVGFVPRMHWLDEEKDGVAHYGYGGWWSVWWMGTYSMVLTKAAFFHRKYLEMYTYNMPSPIRDYVSSQRNCEDIAMSLLVANATGAPPIWIKGKVHEIGSYGISSLKGHSEQRTKCLNYFVSLYGTMPLASSHLKVVDARKQWLW